MTSYRAVRSLLGLFFIIALLADPSWAMEAGFRRILKGPKKPSTIDIEYKNAVFAAIEAGDLKKLMQIFKAEKEIHDDAGRTALYAAVDERKIKIAGFLLDQGHGATSPNKKRFISRSLGRREFKSLTDTQEKTKDRLDRAGRMNLNDLFATENLTKKSRSSFDKDVAIDPETERLNALSKPRVFWGVHASGKQTTTEKYDTPLFAIARRKKPNNCDFKMAQLLFRYRARLDVKDKVQNKTPLQIIEMRMRRLIGLSHSSSAIHVRQSDKKAKGLFAHAMKHASFYQELTPYWYLFADYSSTRDLIKAHGKTFDMSNLPFKDEILEWSLDINLPTPAQAWQRYEDLAPYLEEEEKFSMLLRYLILHSRANNLRKLINPKKSSSAKLKSILKSYSPTQIARAIYLADREWFLAIDPKHVAVRCARRETNEILEASLNRIGQMREVVAVSILNRKDKDAAVKKWQKVAEKLLTLNDLLGYWMVGTGINDNSVSLLIGNEHIDQLPIKVTNKEYIKTKNTLKNLKRGMIPTLNIEEGGLLTAFEAISDEHITTVFVQKRDLVRTMVDNLSNLQKKIYNNPPQFEISSEKMKRLHSFFTHLNITAPPNGASDFLVGSRTVLENDNLWESHTAEHWDSREWFKWLSSQGLADRLIIKSLVQQGIIDGQKFLENYVLSQSARKHREAGRIPHSVIKSYEQWCNKNRRPALGNLSAKHQFPADLLQNPCTSFHWIMWLRNNDLGTAIVPLFDSNARSFSQFLNIFENSEGFNKKLFFDEAASMRLLHLFDLYAVLNNQADDITQWNLLDIEAWLFQNNLSHLIKLIEQDQAWNADRFLAYLYFGSTFKRNQRLTLGINNAWYTPVFEGIKEKIPLKRLFLNRFSQKLPPLTDQNRHSFMYFIHLLHDTNSVLLLPDFYERDVHTLDELEKTLNAEDESSSSRVDSMTPGLRDTPRESFSDTKPSAFDFGPEKADALENLLDNLPRY